LNAEEYTKMYEHEDRYWWFVGRRNLALRLLQKYKDSVKPTVLDLGCGTGVVLRELTTWASPVGFDMSDQALGYCRQRKIHNLVRGNGEVLPFEKDSFDAIVGLDIYEHIADDRAAFSESLRVLRPGGIVVLSVPAFQALWGPHDVALHHHRRYRAAEVRERLRTAGFEPVRVGYSVFFLFPIVVLWRFAEKRKKGPAKASLVGVPGWANRILVAIQNVEALLISGINLPWGSSVIAVGRKPKGP
jgi:SAM-dependent methyltransferase